ncbi:FERM domain-containing protein 5 isoform X4 [Bemisia tabaci]|uniref:FERM domain-containing protein 5 isoform X4 n=1 Tax=Bemisia tabaci TaxID=7038 RepID=UPI0019473DF8
MIKFGSRNDVNAVYKCTVRLLDDTEILECDFKAQHKGKYLLDYVCEQLNLVEKDYFGLRYVDSNKQRHWLDQTKAVLKQVKDMDPILLSFRVKFYPPDPFRLKEEITRYQIYLQLKRDLLHGRLYCAPNEAALLAAYVVQGELGDYDPEEHVGNYVSDLKILLKQSEQVEEKIMEIHQTQLRGQSPTQTESNFLRKACSLDTYGVDPHPVKDQRGSELYLGINHLGILTFQGSRKTNHFRWTEVQKINYEGKMFIVHLTYNEDPRTKKKQTVGFKCATGASCKHVWRCAVEQMLFFTLPSSSDAPHVVTGGSIFSFGTKFKYSGRVEREILEDSTPTRREEPTINRVGSLRRKASSVPATPSTPVIAELVDGVTSSEKVHDLHDNHVDKKAKDGESNFGDYYYRDGMDQSSSELASQSHRSSRSQTPVSRGNKNATSAFRFHISSAPKGSKVLKFLRVVIPSILIVLLFLFLMVVIILETDYEVLAMLRRAPEMIMIRRRYYEPAKEFLKSRFLSYTTDLIPS